jgi:arylsulfatase A-like enzyme
LRTSRPLALALGFACLAVLPLGSCAPSRPRPPKGILVLLVDCLRYDHVGMDGAKLPATPSLDATRDESVVFRRAFSVSSWTRPSVPSLLTGLYPTEHGLGDFVTAGAKVEAQALSPEVTTLAEGMKAAGYRTALVAYQAQLSPRFGMDQGFDFYNNNTMGAEKIHRRFLGWLDEEPGKPFFAYLHYLDVHWPYCPPAETRGKFDPEPDRIQWCENWRKLRDDIRSGAVLLTDDDKRALAARYAEELLALDGQIGAFFAELKKRGLWDDTLIVVTADHGEEFLEHGGMSHGRTLFEEMLRVPLIFAGAGVKPGVVHQSVTIADVAPTLAEMAGLAALAEADGISLAGSVREGEEPPARPLFADETKATKDQEMLHRHAVLSGSLKLLQNMQIGYGLFDLGVDPGEQRDLWASSGDRAAGLESMLTLRDSRKKNLTGWRSRPVPTAVLSNEDKERMRALGYDPD